jgi:heme-degrading monooxygenase HmoA
MIGVIFEVCPHSHARQDYLAMAARLAPLLAEIDGFITIERFQSLNQSEKILSLSFWRDEDAVQRWRNTDEHRAAQLQGRAALFADYRLRIVGVVRDYGLREREQVPPDSRTVHG